MLPPTNLKQYLDSQYQKYCVPEFIPKDPIKFVHRFDNEKDKEIIGFLASTIAQGRRTIILQNMEKICKIIDNKPYEFVANFNPNTDAKRFDGFVHFAYKNIAGEDIACIIYLLSQTLSSFGSLKNLFLKDFDKTQKNVRLSLTSFIEYLYSLKPLPNFKEIPQRVKSLIPSPIKGSACKRLNMYLRWMVRKDSVDTGLWSEVPTSMLIIPLDVHVSKISRQLGLTKRKTDDWKTAEEITNKLKEFDSNDPVKYDFAIFGTGVENSQ